METIELNWTLDTRGSKLWALTYRLTNGGTAPVHVLDRMIGFATSEGLELRPELLIVRSDAEEPTTILFTRGYVPPPRSNVMVELIPAVRLLEPRQTLEGEAEVELPLMDRHPNEGPEPLEIAPAQARLEIGIMPVDPPLRTLRMADGETVQTPRFADAFQFQTFVRSSPLPLPETT